VRVTQQSLALASAFLFLAVHDAAAGEGLGPRFQVNTSNLAYDHSPDVAVTPNGSFMVVWYTFANQIRARRFDPMGEAIGNQFQVNTLPTGNYLNPRPRVGLDDAGAAFVVWWRDLADDLVAGRRYDASGSALGTEFVIASGGASYPVVAVDAYGEAMVAWTSLTSSGTDQGSSSIQARRYDGTGAPLGLPFQVNTTTTGTQHRQRISMGPDGSAVVAWRDLSSPQAIRAQRYAASGSPAGGEFLVGNGNHLDTTHAPSGDFVVTWSGAVGGGIRGQRYDASGNPAGSPFVARGAFDPHAVAASPQGDFVLSWQVNDSDLEYLVRGQRFDSLGTPVGGNFQIEFSSSFVGYSDLAFADDGRYVVVWFKNGFGGGGSNVFGRRSGLPALPSIGAIGLVVLAATALVAGVRSLRR
jgi:hypothetical protein